MTINDPLGAFVAHGAIDLQRRLEGPLAGFTFAIKDFFDVAGLPTGAGSPEWLATHEPPTTSAPVVDLLLGAGARLVGKTMTDELAWSLNGENFHYGTPTPIQQLAGFQIPEPRTVLISPYDKGAMAAIKPASEVCQPRA